MHTAFRHGARTPMNDLGKQPVHWTLEEQDKTSFSLAQFTLYQPGNGSPILRTSIQKNLYAKDEKTLLGGGYPGALTKNGMQMAIPGNMKTNMNWIKNLLLLVFSFFICYLILILGDWSLSKFIKLNTNNLSAFNEVIEIEKSRKIKDIKLKEIAISEGYSPFVFPTYIDSNNILSRHLVRKGFSMLAGLPNKKTFLCNEGYGMIRYKSDRFGFRNENVNWNKDIDDLFIGDSFVAGSCVNNKNTLSYIYGKHNNRNSLNLGVIGNNPLHYEVTANIFIPQFTPKNIYIVFYANDYGKFRSHLNKI